MRLNIQTKLMVILLAVGVPTLVAMGLLGYVNGQRTIRTFVEEGLVAINATKARHLESYFADLRKNVEVVGEDRTVRRALSELAAASTGLPDAEEPAELWAYFEKNYPPRAGDLATEPADIPSGRRLQELYVARNPRPLDRHDEYDGGADGSAYTRAHREHHPHLRRLRDAYGLNNIMLVDRASRRIVYAVRKHADFQASVDAPLLQGTNLKEAAEAALGGRTTVVDFQRFAPAFNLPVAYIAAPIREGEAADGSGRVVGCVVAQIKIEEMNKILSSDGNWRREGLGLTGDSYVIGEDRKLRTDTRTLKEDPDKLLRDLRTRSIPQEELDYIRDKRTTVLAFAIDTPAAFNVVKGESGFMQIRGFVGASIFAAYQPLDIEGLRWGIISRRNTDEALAPMVAFRRNALLAAGGLMLVIAGVAIALAQNFVRPIESLSHAARRFAEGERGIRLAEVHRDDEFGQLARQFNAMVEESDRQEKIQNGIRRNIVHDLKTPVTVIKGMGETLMFPEMAEDPTWREEMVRAIVEQSDRLLDDLKDILQPVKHGYRPELEEFDLSLLLERVVKAEKHTSRAVDHLLLLSGTNAPIPIVGDRRKLRRVYENLLSNAIKYSPGTGKRVWVDVLRQEDGSVTVAFRDEGLGMEPGQLAEVLTKGGRVERHADLGIEGTGFGLDSVQTVLHAHGGRLEATSEPNRGSTFTAILPLRVKTGAATA